MLDNTQQSLLTAVSMLLLGLGPVSVLFGVSVWISIIVVLAGAVGLGIQEALGAIPTESPIAGVPDWAQSVLTLIAYVLMALGVTLIPDGHPTLAIALILFGGAGHGVMQFLGAAQATGTGGFTDTTQAVISLISSILFGIGAVNVAQGGSTLGGAIMFIGIMAAVVQQFGGTKPTTSPTAVTVTAVAPKA